MSLRSSILLPVLIAWHGQGTAARSTACTPPDPSENITCAAINITESKRIDPGSGDELRCAGALPCSTCTPPCEKGSIYTGEPLLCKSLPQRTWDQATPHPPRSTVQVESVSCFPPFLLSSSPPFLSPCSSKAQRGHPVRTRIWNC